MLTVNQRKQLIDSIIENCGIEGGPQIFLEDDRSLLEATPDNRLIQLSKAIPDWLTQNAEEGMNDHMAEGGGEGERAGDEEEEGETEHEMDYSEHGDEAMEDKAHAQHGGVPKGTSGYIGNQQQGGQKTMAKKPKANISTNQQQTLTRRAAVQPVENAKVNTLESWLAQAPTEVRSLVENALNVENEQRQILIKKITANSRNLFTINYLQSRTLDELKGLATLAGGNVAAQPHFLGQAAPIANETADDPEDVLTVPTINYAELAANRRKSS